MKTLGEWTNASWKQWQESQSAILRVLIYLTDTRDERKKGNKLAPEKIVWDVLTKHVNELKD
jgi:hypothetical protein